MKFRYITIPADVIDDNAQQFVKNLLGLLHDGWTIESSAGVAGGVHYVLSNRDSISVTDLKPMGETSKSP